MKELFISLFFSFLLFVATSLLEQCCFGGFIHQILLISFNVSGCHFFCLFERCRNCFPCIQTIKMYVDLFECSALSQKEKNLIVISTGIQFIFTRLQFHESKSAKKEQTRGKTKRMHTRPYSRRVNLYGFVSYVALNSLKTISFLLFHFSTLLTPCS